MENQSELLSPEQASAYLGKTPAATLQWWRAKGRGPKYVKLGRKVYYRRSDLEAFISAGECVPEVG